MSKTGVDDSEPKENDKCITPPNTGTGTGDNGVGHCVEPEFTKKSKIAMFHEHVDSAKDVITKKHKLIIAILGVLVFILLLIVIILAVSLGTSSNYAQEMCVTSSCLSAAASIVRSVNTSVDPCNDFWSFSCGGWISNHPLDDNRGAYSVRDQLERHVNRDIRHYIDLIKTDDDQTHTPEWKVRRLYQSCMEYSVNDVSVFENKIFVDFSGWSITNKFSKAKWNFQESLEELFGKYGVNAFFSVNVDVDDQNSGSSIIKIEPSGLGLPHRDFYYDAQYDSYMKAYQNLMTDVAIKLKIDSLSASQFGKNMIAFEQRLAEITPTMKQMQSPYKYEKMRVRDLGKDMPRVKWTQFLQTIYKKANIKDSTYVLVAFPDYFKALGPLISSLDDASANSYLVWRFIFDYLPYINRDMSDLHKQFLLRMEGVMGNTLLPPTEKWEFCIRTTTKFLGEAVGAIYIKNRMEAESTAIADVSKMIEIMSSTLLNKLDDYPWIRDKISRLNLKQKVKEMALNSSIGIGYPKFIADMRIIQKHYDPYIVTRDFFECIIAGFSFMRRVEEERLMNPLAGVNNWKVLPTDLKVQYNPAGNQLIVASGAMRYPFYEHDLPLPMKFGALGFQIASQMLRTVNSLGLHYDPRGAIYKNEEFGVYSKDTWNSQNSSEQCLMYDIDDHKPRNADYQVDSSLTAPQTFSDVLGLQLVYDSYKKYSSQHGEGGIVPGLSRSNDQLFFISLAQSMCETVRPEYAKSHYKSLTTLPAEERIELLLRQVKQFQSTFSCDSHSKVCRV